MLSPEATAKQIADYRQRGEHPPESLIKQLHESMRPTLQECPWSMHGSCQIISALSGGAAASVDAGICQRCQSVHPAMAVNVITCSIAQARLKSDGKPPDPDLARCASEVTRSGVGSTLEAILATAQYCLSFLGLGWLLAKSENCTCHEIRNEMNAVGIPGCEERTWEFAERIVASYRKRHSWARYLTPGAQAAAYLLICVAIHRYAKSKESPCAT